jgi:hypothetical protein
MDSQKAAAELKVIRQLMERPVRYSSMSGLSGILAGCVTLAGLVTDALVCEHWGVGSTTMWINLCVWAGVFLAALAGTLGLTRVRELRQGMPLWSPIKRKILMTILPPFVAGAGLTAAIVSRWYTHQAPNEWGLITPAWMLFYGVACWQVGEFSIRELRFMGAAFILAGLLSAAFWQASVPGLNLPPGTAPYLTLGATFGGFHIVYGVVVRIRYGG